MINEIDVKTGKIIQRDYTPEEIQAKDLAFKEQQKNLARIKILNQLAEIDMKSIRAIRENDEARIQALENEAEQLRQKLKGL